MHTVNTIKNVVKLDSEGEFLLTYEYGTDLTPKKIIASKDAGMMYVCTTDYIVKLTENGTIIGYIGTNDLNYTPIYTSLIHEDDRNLYLCEQKHILRYVDYITIFSSRINSGVVWNNITVNKQEFVQDWVYLKAFHRFWDNMEYIRKSLYGKVVESTESGLTVLSTSPRTEAEWFEFNYDKTNIILGVNEFCTAPVINRLIDQCYDCLEILLEMVDIR